VALILEFMDNTPYQARELNAAVSLCVFVRFIEYKSHGILEKLEIGDICCILLCMAFF
jgi:hypothetical protein